MTPSTNTCSGSLTSLKEWTANWRLSPSLVLTVSRANIFVGLQNAGVEVTVVLSKVRAEKGENYGYSAAPDTYGDLVKEGVLDPAKVVRIALQNASSIAGLMLTTEALIAEIPEKEKAPGGASCRRDGRRDVTNSRPAPAITTPGGCL
jgi:TCP-1/cpn60 chaperonin family